MQDQTATGTAPAADTPSTPATEITSTTTPAPAQDVAKEVEHKVETAVTEAATTVEKTVETDVKTAETEVKAEVKVEEHSLHTLFHKFKSRVEEELGMIRVGKSGIYHQSPGDVSAGFDGTTECAAIITGGIMHDANGGTLVNLAVFSHMPEQMSVMSKKGVSIGTATGQFSL